MKEAANADTINNSINVSGKTLGELGHRLGGIVGERGVVAISSGQGLQLQFNITVGDLVYCGIGAERYWEGRVILNPVPDCSF